MNEPTAAGLGKAALLLLFAYGGFENAAAPAGEFVNPKRDVPFALMMVIAITTLLYTLVQLVALGTLPDLASRAAGAPLADSAAVVAGVWAGAMMTFGATVSIGGNAAGTTTVGPRYLYEMAKDGSRTARSRRSAPALPHARMGDRDTGIDRVGARALGIVRAARHALGRCPACHLYGHGGRPCRCCAGSSGRRNTPSCSPAEPRFRRWP